MKKRLILAIIVIVMIPAVAYAQTLLWQKTYNGPDKKGDQGFGVTIDNKGNAIIVGSTFVNGNDSDVFLRKYSPSGSTIWTKIFDEGSKGSESRMKIASDKNNNIYVAFSTNKPNNTEGAPDYYSIRRYSASGSLIWKKKIDTSDADLATSIASDGTNLLVASKKAYLHKTIITKYKPDGTVAWSKSMDPSIYGIATDSSGNIYITGDTGEIPYGKFWARKYSASGVVKWTITGSNDTRGRDCVIDNNGNLVVLQQVFDSAKYILSKYKVVKYSSSGSLKWSKDYLPTLSSGATILFNRLTIDSDNNIYLVGAKEKSERDIFFRKLSPGGKVIWDKTFNGPGIADADEGNGIAIDKNKNIYIVGTVKGVDQWLQNGDIWLGKFKQ